jgi:hypothetical protein
VSVLSSINAVQMNLRTLDDTCRRLSWFTKAGFALAVFRPVAIVAHRVAAIDSNALADGLAVVSRPG